jgi:hypothetical protein
MVVVEERLVDDPVRREGVVLVGGRERRGYGAAVFDGGTVRSPCPCTRALELKIAKRAS